MSERIFGVFWLALCAGMAWVAWNIEIAFSYEPVGPRVLPIILALLMAICGGLMIIRPGPDPHWPGAVVAPRMLIMVVVLFAYAWFFEILGFPLATALFVTAVGLLFGGHWLKCAITGVLMGGFLYIMFDRVLEVTLPLGRIFRAAGG
jgi:putative tricarboxylic transport membrane protein